MGTEVRRGPSGGRGSREWPGGLEGQGRVLRVSRGPPSTRQPRAAPRQSAHPTAPPPAQRVQVSGGSGRPRAGVAWPKAICGEGDSARAGAGAGGSRERAGRSRELASEPEGRDAGRRPLPRRPLEGRREGGAPLPPIPRARRLWPISGGRGRAEGRGGPIEAGPAAST